MSPSTRIALGARTAASRPALTPRLVPSRPPHALRWASSSRSSLPLSAAISAAFPKAPAPSSKYKKSPQARPAATIEVRGDGLPGFIPLDDPAPFTHPSLFQTKRWPFEQPQSIDGVPYTHYDYEKLAAFGDRILRMLLMEFIQESCPQLSTAGTISLLKCLTSSGVTCPLARSFRLHVDRLQADPAALPQLQGLLSVQADLLRAYIAGLFNEQGYATTRLWVRQAFNASLGEQYARLKKQIEATPAPSATPAPTSTPAPARRKESPAQKLGIWAVRKKVEIRSKYAVEGEEPTQVHKCWLRLEGREFAGEGDSQEAAKTSAAASALLYAEELDARNRIKAKPTPNLPGPSAHGNRTSRFIKYCHNNKLEFAFVYSVPRRCADPDLVLCTLNWGSEEASHRHVKAVGLGKSKARDLAVKAALESMGLP
ncbi:hypothetical protein BCR35DRAFT_352519 [Leucosporidium creatinivorum]|uniref:RNase III domain-containing protein n=1 Tax=Leucosporidium creatinivorum TaxID=106004 RepID=A0A1Y2FA35_9BASI|nr:hypothetical protein BCR35DRAFT_352519 [Leucosporidium creatinivorum]